MSIIDKFIPIVESSTIQLLTKPDVSIEIRPFLVSEEKILLMGSEEYDKIDESIAEKKEILREVDEDTLIKIKRLHKVGPTEDNFKLLEKIIESERKSGQKSLFEAAKQVVINCTKIKKTQGDLDLDNMAVADFLWVFLQLRKISKGNDLILEIVCSDKTCTEKIEDENVRTRTPVKINLDNDVEIHKEKTETITKIDSQLGVEMCETKLSFVEKVKFGKEFVDLRGDYAYFESIAHHIVALVKGNERHVPTIEETKVFLDSLNEDQFKTLVDRYVKETTLSLNAKTKCRQCGKELEVEEYDFLDFLA